MSTIPFSGDSPRTARDNAGCRTGLCLVFDPSQDDPTPRRGERGGCIRRDEPGPTPGNILLQRGSGRSGSLRRGHLEIGETGFNDRPASRDLVPAHRYAEQGIGRTPPADADHHIRPPLGLQPGIEPPTVSAISRVLDRSNYIIPITMRRSRDAFGRRRLAARVVSRDQRSRSLAPREAEAARRRRASDADVPAAARGCPETWLEALCVSAEFASCFGISHLPAPGTRHGKCPDSVAMEKLCCRRRAWSPASGRSAGAIGTAEPAPVSARHDEGG